MPYCFNCGAETEEGAAYCGSCGTRLEGEAPTAPSRPPVRAGFPWAILVAIVVVVVIVAGGVALFGVLAGDDDDEERLPGAEEQERVEAAPSPTVAPTIQATAAVETTPAPDESPRVEPTSVPPAAGHATPEDAIAAYLQEYGVDYTGDCAFIDLDTDIGLYCSMLWEDRGDQLIYDIGLAFSEPDTWLLLEVQGETGGWLVVDTAEFVPGPQDTVPPWP